MVEPDDRGEKLDVDGPALLLDADDDCDELLAAPEILGEVLVPVCVMREYSVFHVRTASTRSLCRDLHVESSMVLFSRLRHTFRTLSHNARKLAHTASVA